MNRPIQLSARAKEDLSDQLAYLLQEASEPVAQRFDFMFQHMLELLSTFPYLGRAYSLSDGPEGLRAIPVLKFLDYLIFYTVEAEAVRVLRVLHGKQDLAAIFRELQEPPG